MYSLPEYTIVLGCKQSKKYKIIEKVLKDYFECMPYIPFIGYDKKTTYCILPHNGAIARILESLYDYMTFYTNIDIIAFTTYVYEHNIFTSDNYNVLFRSHYNKMLPPTIKMDSTDKEKLSLFISECA